MWVGFGGAVVGVGWSWWGRVTCPENCQCQHYKTEAQVVGILKVFTSPNGMTKINSPFLVMPGFWRASVHPLLSWARPPSPSLMTKGSESPLRKVREVSDICGNIFSLMLKQRQHSIWLKASARGVERGGGEVSHNIYFTHLNLNLNDAHHLFTLVFDPHLALDRTRRSVVYDPNWASLASSLVRLGRTGPSAPSFLVHVWANKVRGLQPSVYTGFNAMGQKKFTQKCYGITDTFPQNSRFDV